MIYISDRGEAENYTPGTVPSYLKVFCVSAELVSLNKASDENVKVIRQKSFKILFTEPPKIIFALIPGTVQVDVEVCQRQSPSLGCSSLIE